MRDIISSHKKRLYVTNVQFKVFMTLASEQLMLKEAIAMNKRIPFAAMITLIGVLGLFIVACGQPAPAAAPAGPTAEEIRSIVQQEVANVPAPAPAPAPAMPEPGPSAEEIAMMVEDAVSGAVPEGVSASEIEGIVDAAIMAASEDDLTEGEVAEIVAMEVQKASAGQAEPLTADEVNRIVMAAIEAIPAPEPVAIPTPAMMMPGPLRRANQDWQRP